MADRVHPSTTDTTPLTSANNSGEHPSPPNPPPSNPVPPPPATYVVQFPKEQILRYPPPENARKFQHLTKRKSNRSFCRRCCCYTLGLLFLILIAAAISAGVLYLVFRFRSPVYAITALSVAGMNVTSAAPISPGFNVTLRAENPNGKVGIEYLRNGAVNVVYNGVRLSDGALPAFYQARRNVTVLHTAVRGNDVVLGGDVRRGLRNAVNRGRVPFVVRVRAPVKIRVGRVNTWVINVRVRCDVVVDALNQTARIISNDCDYGVRLW